MTSVLAESRLAQRLVEPGVYAGTSLLLTAACSVAGLALAASPFHALGLGVLAVYVAGWHVISIPRCRVTGAWWAQGSPWVSFGAAALFMVILVASMGPPGPATPAKLIETVGGWSLLVVAVVSWPLGWLWLISAPRRVRV